MSRWDEVAERTVPLRHAAPGDHLCSFAGSARERRGLAAAFVHSGLGAGDRVVYVSDGRLRGEIEQELEVDGVDARRLQRRGQLVLLDVADADALGAGRDVPEGLAGLRAAMERAREEGFAGVHLASESDRLLPPAGSMERLLGWEDRVTEISEELGAVVMCQYTPSRIPAPELSRIARHHAGVAEDDGSRPIASIAAGPSSHTIELSGELDLSNAAALSRALGARAALGLGVEVDMAAVSFIDLSAVRAIFRAAERLAPRREIRLTRVPQAVRQVIELSGCRDGRVRVEGA